MHSTDVGLELASNRDRIPGVPTRPDAKPNSNFTNRASLPAGASAAPRDDLRRSIRATVRLSGLAAVIAATMVLLVFDRVRRSSYRARALRLQWACRTLLRVMKIRYASSGHPPEGVIIAANHLSYLDVLVLSAITPAVFVAKREVRQWPAVGLIAALAGTRFIDRTQRGDVVRVADELAPVLREGVSVVLFLEGTSTDGREVRPFKSSLLEPAFTHNWSIVPAALRYEVPTSHSAAMEVCWWGDMTLPPHLRNLATLPWVEARVGWGKPLDKFGDRKALARAARDRVVELSASLHGAGCQTAVV